MKWPEGYVYEKCGCTHYYYMTLRNRYCCTSCHHDERLLTNYEWKYNHRNTKNILSKISHYLQLLDITTKRMIIDSMNSYALHRGMSLS